MAERRDFHFVFGLREQTEPFHLLHYLCLASCLDVNQPDAIHFHYRNEPFGPWWDRIRPQLILHKVQGPTDGYTPERYRNSAEGRLIEHLQLGYAHEADFLRMDILLQHGGAYADIDTLFVRRYPDEWFAEEFVIAEENAPGLPGKPIAPSLCNAVMLARPQARFAALWRARMTHAFDGTWSHHSCQEAARVWFMLPDAVRVLPAVYFYRYGSSVAGFQDLFEAPAQDNPDIFSIHLWSHLWWAADRTDFSTVHAGQIDERWVHERDCVLAHHARRFL